MFSDAILLDAVDQGSDVSEMLVGQKRGTLNDTGYRAVEIQTTSAEVFFAAALHVQLPYCPVAPKEMGLDSSQWKVARNIGLGLLVIRCIRWELGRTDSESRGRGRFPLNSTCYVVCSVKLLPRSLSIIEARARSREG